MGRSEALRSGGSRSSLPRVADLDAIFMRRGGFVSLPVLPQVLPAVRVVSAMCESGVGRPRRRDNLGFKSPHARQSPRWGSAGESVYWRVGTLLAWQNRTC